jgi:hypothetical protein
MRALFFTNCGVHESLLDAVDGSSTGTSVPWMGTLPMPLLDWDVAYWH